MESPPIPPPSASEHPPATTPSCPRCRVRLSMTQDRNPRDGRMTTLLCPSMTCGYKLLVPQ